MSCIKGEGELLRKKMQGLPKKSWIGLEVWLSPAPTGYRESKISEGGGQGGKGDTSASE